MHWAPACAGATDIRFCKMPVPSLLRRQEPSLKHSFSCRAGRRHQNENNQIFDFIWSLLFSEICKTSKALLSTGHTPARVRQIFGFAKVSGRLKKRFQTASCPMRTITLCFHKANRTYAGLFVEQDTHIALAAGQTLTHSRNLSPLPWERARERATSQRLVCRYPKMFNI